MTRRYSAPELLNDAPRNSSADIWSLGCVFLEMVTVIKGQSVARIRAFLESFGNQSTVYALNEDGVQTWIDEMKMVSLDNIPLEWTRQMLRRRSVSRPTAQQLFKTIMLSSAAGDFPGAFLGPCCMTDNHPSEIADPASSKPSGTRKKRVLLLPAEMAAMTLGSGLAEPKPGANGPKDRKSVV